MHTFIVYSGLGSMLNIPVLRRNFAFKQVPKFLTHRARFIGTESLGEQAFPEILKQTYTGKIMSKYFPSLLCPKLRMFLMHISDAGSLRPCSQPKLCAPFHAFPGAWLYKSVHPTVLVKSCTSCAGCTLNFGHCNIIISTLFIQNT